MLTILQGCMLCMQARGGGAGTILTAVAPDIAHHSWCSLVHRGDLVCLADRDQRVRQYDCGSQQLHCERVFGILAEDRSQLAQSSEVTA